MATIGFSAIIGVLGKVWQSRNEAKYWSGWITDDGDKRTVTVNSVAFDETGLELKITDGTEKHTLKAAPAGVEHTHVLLDGQVVQGAGLVFEPKPTMFDQTRFAFDFRPIPLHGNQARFNMRFDP